MKTAPLILAFDTSDAHCAVCVLEGDNILADAFQPMTKGQAENLMVSVRDVLDRAKVALQRIDAIAVGVGPGNFTGIRIGISAARGLALGLGIPAIGVSRFEALYHGYSGAMLATVDARRDLVFVQGFGTAHFDQPALVPRETVTATGLPVVGHGGSDPQMGVAEATARVAAKRVHSGAAASRPSPLYLRAADAAPPRDTPPPIVP